jgi:hypothetical protein
VLWVTVGTVENVDVCDKICGLLMGGVLESEKMEDQGEK